jgi:hypothetical protein
MTRERGELLRIRGEAQAGHYWLVQFKTKEECIEWAKQAPFKEGEIEIRQLFELEGRPAA